MKIQLSDHFGFGRLLRFTIPSIVMLIFTSIYSVVDGWFISNVVGTTPFAAINLIMPATMILGGVGFMFGAGGCALVSKTLGEGDRDMANRIFSMLTYIAIGIGVLLSAVGIIFMEDIAVILGADEEMLPYCVVYARTLLIALPAFMLQNMFQSFLVAAEKPTLGLAVTVAAGVTNMALDALFIAVFRWGVIGAAAATATAQCVGGIIPLVYFLSKKATVLRLTKTRFYSKAFFTTCFNGSSELVTNISLSVVSMIFNLQLMRYAGQSGVAAYGAVMYVSFAFIAIFIGYSVGVAPVVGYHYGAQNRDELKNLYSKSLILILISSVILAGAAFVFARPISAFFLGSADAELIDMTVRAFRFYSISVLFCGFGIFGSAFFTALNNGFISAMLSFMRLFLFQVIAVIVLPVIFGLDGIWYALFVPESVALMLTFGCLLAKAREYGY